jgi:hypothetical protein
MTAAPTYTWEYAYDLFGDRVPKIVTLEITAASLVKTGTLMSMVTGQAIATTDGTGDYIIGLAAQDIATSPAGGDPVKIAVIAPGMVIKGTATDTAASISGFYGKAIDVDATGALDPDDVTNGGLSVLRTEDSGLTVWCVLTGGAIF